MQITSFPFWFNIVSIAIAVLPVCLSPIINSLWPFPIGIIESIALIPVCNGSLTDCLSIILGAGTSIGLVSLVIIGPLPSISSPNELTTLPSIPSPTGTSTILLVLFTISPSFIPSSDPRSILHYLVQDLMPYQIRH